MDDAGKMWIFGGDSSNGYPRNVYCLDTQATPPRWTSPATNGESPAGRFGHSAVMDGTGKMWIFGGRPSSSSSSFLDDVHVLDTQATPPTWTSPTTSGDSPGARFGHSAVMDGTGKMWIFGGDRNGFLDDVFTLQTQVDPPEWANQNLTNPLGRYGHTAVIEANGKMWIFGGHNSTSSYLDDVYYLHTQEASPLTWVFPDLSGSSPPGRLLHGAVLDNNGTLWVTGGTGSSDSFLDDVFTLQTQVDPPEWASPTTIGTNPPGRYGHTAVLDRAGKIWTFGGRDSRGYLDDVYYLDTEATTTTSTSSTITFSSTSISSTRSSVTTTTRYSTTSQTTSSGNSAAAQRLLELREEQDVSASRAIAWLENQNGAGDDPVLYNETVQTALV